MTDEMTETDKALRDALLYGTGVMKDDEHIPLHEVQIPAPADDVKELIERLEVVSGTMLDWSDNNYETASKLNGEQAVQFQNQGDEFAEETLTHLSEENAAKDKEIAELRAAKLKLSDSDLHYLRSIYDNLTEFRNLVNDAAVGPSLGGEVLADNWDWLDCFIDMHTRQALSLSEEET